MTIRKMMLLATALAALIAFAAPAAASAQLQWHTPPEEVVEEEEGYPTLEGNAELSLAGELSTYMPSYGYYTYPCPFRLSGSASNTGVGGAAAGTLTEGSVNEGASCETNLNFAGCDTGNWSLNFGTGWSITTAEPNHVTIHNISYTNRYSSACEPFLPRSLTTSGTVEGTLEEGIGPEGEDCIVFEEASGLKTSGAEIRLSGTLCIGSNLRLY